MLMKTIASASIAQLHHLLDAGQALSATYRGQMSNHLPMAQQALLELGASAARLQAFTEAGPLAGAHRRRLFSGRCPRHQAHPRRLAAGSALARPSLAPRGRTCNKLGRMMIRELDGTEALARVTELAEVLRDCVEGGASVGFMLPLADGRPEAFWRRVAQGVAAGERHLFVAEDQAGRICGTLSLVTDMPDNQPHRADVSKMLVHRRARRRGIAERLLKALEAKARELGKTTLVLDTVTGSDASRVYERLGWQKAGDIPNYALMPEGPPCSTTYYFKPL